MRKLLLVFTVAVMFVVFIGGPINQANAQEPPESLDKTIFVPEPDAKPTGGGEEGTMNGAFCGISC